MSIERGGPSPEQMGIKPEGSRNEWQEEQRRKFQEPLLQAAQQFARGIDSHLRAELDENPNTLGVTFRYIGDDGKEVPELSWTQSPGGLIEDEQKFRDYLQNNFRDSSALYFQRKKEQFEQTQRANSKPEKHWTDRL